MIQKIFFSVGCLLMILAETGCEDHNDDVKPRHVNAFDVRGTDNSSQVASNAKRARQIEVIVPRAEQAPLPSLPPPILPVQAGPALIDPLIPVLDVGTPGIPPVIPVPIVPPVDIQTFIDENRLTLAWHDNGMTFETVLFADPDLELAMDHLFCAFRQTDDQYCAGHGLIDLDFITNIGYYSDDCQVVGLGDIPTSAIGLDNGPGKPKTCAELQQEFEGFLASLFEDGGKLIHQRPEVSAYLGNERANVNSFVEVCDKRTGGKIVAYLRGLAQYHILDGGDAIPAVDWIFFTTEFLVPDFIDGTHDPMNPSPEYLALEDCPDLTDPVCDDEIESIEVCDI